MTVSVRTLCLLLCLVTFFASGVQSIKELGWQSRILVIDTNNEEQFRLIAETCHYFSGELTDRKLQVYMISGDKYFTLPDTDIPGDINDVRRASHTVLIGLDGGVKATFPTSKLDFERVFAAIDRMPMRRAELDARPGG